MGIGRFLSNLLTGPGKVAWQNGRRAKLLVSVAGTNTKRHEENTPCAGMEMSNRCTVQAYSTQVKLL